MSNESTNTQSQLTNREKGKDPWNSKEYWVNVNEINFDNDELDLKLPNFGILQKSHKNE